MTRLSTKKIALIHVAKRQLCLDDDSYRDVLGRAGVQSAADLDEDGFELVMALFERMGFVSDKTKRSFGNRPGMATARQVDFIRGLWRDYTDGAGTDASLGKWLARQFKVSALRFVDQVMAPKVISTLQIMVRQKKAKRSA